jgi:hypothetical protein
MTVVQDPDSLDALDPCLGHASNMRPTRARVSGNRLAPNPEISQLITDEV